MLILRQRVLSAEQAHIVAQFSAAYFSIPTGLFSENLFAFFVTCGHTKALNWNINVFWNLRAVNNVNIMVILLDYKRIFEENYLIEVSFGY